MSYALDMRSTVPPAERATERINVRWKPTEKDAVRRAAELADLPLATVVVNGALREAARLERQAKRGDEGG